VIQPTGGGGEFFEEAAGFRHFLFFYVEEKVSYCKHIKGKTSSGKTMRDYLNIIIYHYYIDNGPKPQSVMVKLLSW
jgi:hypothetical protein